MGAALIPSIEARREMGGACLNLDYALTRQGLTVHL